MSPPQPRRNGEKEKTSKATRLAKRRQLSGAVRSAVGVLLPFLGWLAGGLAARRICLSTPFLFLFLPEPLVLLELAAAAPRYYVIMAIIATRLWRHLWHFWTDDSLACLTWIPPSRLTLRCVRALYVVFPRFPEITERQAGCSRLADCIAITNILMQLTHT